MRRARHPQLQKLVQELRGGIRTCLPSESREHVTSCVKFCILFRLRTCERNLSHRTLVFRCARKAKAGPFETGIAHALMNLSLRKKSRDPMLRASLAVRWPGPLQSLRSTVHVRGQVDRDCLSAGLKNWCEPRSSLRPRFGCAGNHFDTIAHSCTRALQPKRTVYAANVLRRRRI